MNKIAKERIIYNNYDLWETYPDDELMKIAKECGWIEDGEEVSEETMTSWRYQLDEDDWASAKQWLDDFFKGKIVGFFGHVGLWHGTYATGKIGEFWKLFYKATEDCGYIKLYDENGHLYLTCSHHDGTCHYEIKEITDKGEEYLANWEDNWNDKRSERYVHGQILKRYSKILRYVEKQFGCSAREYEPITKGRLIDKLNNEAKSFYTA